MPFTTEVVTRTVIVHTCNQCKRRKEFQGLSFGEVVTCNECQTNESFTGKQDIRYDIHGNQDSKLIKVLNNPWVVSIITGLIVVLLVSSVVYITISNTNFDDKPHKSPIKNETISANGK